MAGKNKKSNIFVLYYDKFLVILVLIGLLVSLGYLTTTAVKSRHEEEEYIAGLNKKMQESGNLKAYPMQKYENATALFQKPVKLSVPDIRFATFITPESRVCCENPECGKPIPLDDKVCIFCGKAQQVKAAEREDLDSDKDGIPDKIEIALGLDPKDPKDALADLDKDGFTNIAEFIAKTDLKDPKSHPELVNMLAVKELRSKKVPLRFSSCNRMPDGRTQMVFNQVRPLPQTFYVKEGEMIGKSGYKVVKLEQKVERRKDPKTLLPKEVNVSTVDLIRVADKKEVTLVCGGAEKNMDVEAVLIFKLDDSTYTVLEKQSFKVRDESFKVISIDMGNGTVLIENETTKKEKVIRKLDS